MNDLPRRYFSAANALRTLGDLWRERRHRLHILTFTGVPSRSMVCLWTLALKRVLVCRLEWLTLLPLIPDFKQIWQRIGQNLSFRRPAAYSGPHCE